MPSRPPSAAVRWRTTGKGSGASTSSRVSRCRRARTSRSCASCASRWRAAWPSRSTRWRKIDLGYGRASISRENGRRYIGIRMNVRGRDLGGFVEEARAQVAAQAPNPPGVHDRVGRRVREQGARHGAPGRGRAGGAGDHAGAALQGVRLLLAGGADAAQRAVRPARRGDRALPRRHADVGGGGGRVHRAHRAGVAQRRAGAVGGRGAPAAGRAAAGGDRRGDAGSGCGRC